MRVHWGGRGGGLTIDIVLVDIFFYFLFVSGNNFSGWEFGEEIIVIFCRVDSLDAEGGKGFYLVGEGETSREIWILACFGFFALFLVSEFCSGLV